MQSDGGERDIKRGILLCLGGLFSLISGARGDDAVVHQAGGEELYRDRGGYRGLYFFGLAVLVAVVFCLGCGYRVSGSARGLRRS